MIMETSSRVVHQTDTTPAMGKQRFMAVVSPRAGNFSRNVLQEIADIFAREGLAVDFYPINDTQQPEEQVAGALNQGYYSYLAVGGDGSVSLLASKLKGQPHRLGIIPTGTTNTIARVLGIPLSVRKAIALAASSSHIRAVDGLEINERVFLLNVSVGLSSISVDRVETKEKSKLGILAYALGVIRSRDKIRVLNFDLQIDGSPCKIRAIEVHVTNTGVIGLPRYRLYPDSRLDDGKAEVLILRQMSLKDISNAVLDILTRRERQAIQLVGQGKDILIQSRAPVEVQADGDIVRQTPVRIRVLCQAINFIVP